MNNIFYNNTKAVRYEDQIENLHIYNNTFGLGNDQFFESAGGAGADFQVLNNLFVATSKPQEAGDASNLAVGEDNFVDTADHDYHLKDTSQAIEAGITITEVATDKDGTLRPQGTSYDVGAYEYAGSILNQPPTVDITADPTTGAAPLMVSFTAIAEDADGTIASYSWEFGDGGTSTEQNPTHTFNNPGNYTVTLTVTDDEGAEASDTVEINVTGGRSPFIISNLTVASGEPYEVVDNGLQIGASVYIDRGFTYSVLPVWLEGATYIKTANDDKASQGDAFLNFDVDQDVTVYIAHDNRITTKPAWLSAFVDTGEDLSTTDTQFSIFEKGFSAGTIILGGNEGSGKSMYTVIIVGATDSTPPATIADVKVSAGSSDTEKTLTWTAPGDDGDVGRAVKYIVKYAVTSIEDRTPFPWDTATEVSDAPTPQPAGSQESMVVTNLPALKDREIYRFAIRAVDDAGNISALDTEPPSVAGKPEHVDE